jgi:predicted permease
MVARSVSHLREVPPGFEAEGVLTMQVALSSAFRGDAERETAAFDEIQARVASLPGVTGAATVSNLPVGGYAAGTSLYAEGTVAPPPGQEPWVINVQVQPGYFSSMGIRLLAGRTFQDDDGAEGGPPVVIVTESFARRAWPDGAALGKRIKYGGADSAYPWMEVVGVVADVRHFGLDRPPELGVYEPFRQFPWWREFLVVRAAADPRRLIPSVVAAVRAVDPAAPVYEIQTMEDVLYRSHWRPIVLSRLLWIFSAVAFLLAALGVYAVVAFSAARRTREFGIRMVLGARGRTILAEAFQQTSRSVALGALGGLAAAWAGMRFAASLLFEIRGLDAGVAALSLLALTGAASVAVYVPARRAARTDPATVLRSE